jgi:hypothetical protein
MFGAMHLDPFQSRANERGVLSILMEIQGTFRHSKSCSLRCVRNAWHSFTPGELYGLIIVVRRLHRPIEAGSTTN